MNIASERGVALLAVMLIALVLFALGTAFSASALTEVSVVRNHQRAAEARAAAEAGLSHAVQLAVRRLNNFAAGGFASPSAAISALLRGPDNTVNATVSHPSNDDNGSFEALELAGETDLPRFPALVVMGAMPGATYQARVLDEDDPSRNLNAADRTRILENGQAQVDANTRAVIQVTGFAMDNTVARIEALLARNTSPAIVSDQTITVSGNPVIAGSDGGIHSNVNLTNSGNPTIAAGYTATGTYSNSGTPVVIGDVGGGRPLIPIPPVNAADYWEEVNEAAGIDPPPLPAAVPSNDGLVLTVGGATGGRIYRGFSNLTTGSVVGSTLVCDASVNNSACLNPWGWQYDPGNAGWKVPGDVLRTNTTFYVRGNVTISGSPGEAPAVYRRVTIIAEGNIEVSGNPWLTPHTPGVMFVMDRDLKLNGNMKMDPAFEGSILVREQMDMSGNKTLYAQIYVDNASNLSNMVINTMISGNPTITYNGSLGGGGFMVRGWREIR